MSSSTREQALRRDREALGQLCRAAQAGKYDSEPGMRDAIRNFTGLLRAELEPQRIAMYNELMQRSVFIEGLPADGPECQKAVKEVVAEKLMLDMFKVWDVCSVFVKMPEAMRDRGLAYAIITFNSDAHCRTFAAALYQDCRVRLRLDGVGVDVQLNCKEGSAPTSQSLTRSYLNFIEKNKNPIKRGEVPPPAPRRVAPRSLVLPRAGGGLSCKAEPATPASPECAAAPKAPNVHELFRAAAEAESAAAAAAAEPAQAGANVKKLTVFHDAENCYIGKPRGPVDDGTLAYNIVSAVKGLAKAEGWEGNAEDMDWQLFLHHAEQLGAHPTKLTLTELSTLGVDHIDPGSKQGSVDMKMKDKMRQFIESHCWGNEEHLVAVLSGDKDFLSEIRLLQDRGFRTIVCHPAQVASAFLRQAEESGPVVLWDKIRREAGGAEHVEGCAAGGFAPFTTSSVRRFAQQPWKGAGSAEAAAAMPHYSSHDTRSSRWGEMGRMRGVAPAQTEAAPADPVDDGGGQGGSSQESAVSSVFEEAASPQTLKHFLGAKIFAALEDKLEELGVDEAEDLRLCDEGDLAELRAGLKKVQAKKFQEKVAELGSPRC